MSVFVIQTTTPKLLLVLLLVVGNILNSVHGAVTFYHHRNDFLNALVNASVVENIAQRGIANPTLWSHRAENRPLPLQQCDLTMATDNGASWIQIWNYVLPEIQAFKGKDAYSFRVGGTYASPRVVETTHQFFAIGFDHVSKGQGNKFTMKVFDGEARQYSSHLANRGHMAKFYGWITDDPTEFASLFEIGPVNNNIIHFMFTNVVYATYEESAVTQLGCHITDAAVRSCSATAWGDPHIITFDGLKYEAHPKGEAIFLRSTRYPLEIQGRLEKIRNNVNAGPAITTGIAIRGDDPTTQADIQITMATAEDAPGTVLDGRTQSHLCPVELYVNGVKHNDLSYGIDYYGPQVTVIGSKVRVEYRSISLAVEMTVQYWRERCYFSTDFHFFDCEEHEDHLIGMLGSPNMNHTDDWMTRNGTVLPQPEDESGYYFQPAFDYVKDNWIITDESESLFYYETGMSFEDFANETEVYDDELERLADDAPPDVKMMCEEDLACLIDGGELGAGAAQEYLDNPATERTFPPTDAPTTSPTEEPAPRCEEERRRQRRLESLEDKWNIGEPVFDYSNLNFTLDFGISASISDEQQIRALVYENDCSSPYNGTGLVYENVTLGNFFAPGFQNAPFFVTIDPDQISRDTQVFKENVPAGGQVTAVVDFCVRFSLYTPPAAGDIEVNFLEVVVKLDIDLTDGFEVDAINVAPFDVCELEANDAFEVEGYFCDDGFENVPVTTTPILNQGQVVKICVRPVKRARDLFMRMRDIRNFTFYGADGATQVAIRNHEVARNGLTEMWCEPGYGVCHFETILFAPFFVRPGAVTGSGFADLQFGGLADDSVTPKSIVSRRRDRLLRALPEDFVHTSSQQVSDEEQQRSLQAQDDDATFAEPGDASIGGGAFDMEFMVQQGRYYHSGGTRVVGASIWMIVLSFTTIFVASNTLW